jgi:hypothetical protein
VYLDKERRIIRMTDKDIMNILTERDDYMQNDESHENDSISGEVMMTLRKNRYH